MVSLVAALIAVAFVRLIGSYLTSENREQRQPSQKHKITGEIFTMLRLGSALNVQHVGFWTVKPIMPQSNPHFTGLRGRAKLEGDAMARAFNASQFAYQSGQRARAKELSNEGNSHKAEMERLNREASQWIFRENNKDLQSGDVDLHGLLVKEAVEFTDKAIVKAQRRGDSEIQLIVGKGIHSQSGHAKVRPAIEKLMRKYKLIAALDPDNAGVLIVQSKRGASVLGAGDLSLKLDSGDNGCMIM